MILERLKQFIDYKGVAVSAFEKSIGMSNASFGKSLKNKGTIGADKLGNILHAYPEINLHWLITGEGEMLKGSDQPENPMVENPQDRMTIDKLFSLIEDQRTEIKLLIGMLKEKDEKIDELRDELDARKGGTAQSVAGSSGASAV